MSQRQILQLARKGVKHFSCQWQCLHQSHEYDLSASLKRPSTITPKSQLPANAGGVRHPGSIPGSGRSPAEGNGSPPQYSCLENPMDRRAWWATVHGVTRVGHD